MSRPLSDPNSKEVGATFTVRRTPFTATCCTSAARIPPSRRPMQGSTVVCSAAGRLPCVSSHTTISATGSSSSIWIATCCCRRSPIRCWRPRKAPIGRCAGPARIPSTEALGRQTSGPTRTGASPASRRTCCPLDRRAVVRTVQCGEPLDPTHAHRTRSAPSLATAGRHRLRVDRHA